ncbi:MAG: type III secretion system export apparatus subunit SctR [Succinivibrionaceae bacterium]|nr:type III secretion system export apparatus subunit SctR [Succinivibrionaceae bacterium]
MSETLNPGNLLLLMAAMGLLPFALTMLTSYCKLIVVISLMKNALGVQQAPPTMVMAGLAMILSIFIMAPVGSEMLRLGSQVQLPATSDFEPAALVRVVDELSPPLKGFLKANSDERITAGFVSAAQRIWPADLHGIIDPDSMLFIIPSFVITELTKAFQIGFLLYLPFIAIDLIVSNILLAMGMMMVSPMAISLPFKLMLFVSLDGWFKLSQGLLYSYAYGGG